MYSATRKVIKDYPKDEIIVNMLPPDKKNWKKIGSPTAYKNYSCGKYVGSYTVRTQKPAWNKRTKWGTKHYDYSDENVSNSAIKLSLHTPKCTLYISLFVLQHDR